MGSSKKHKKDRKHRKHRHSSPGYEERDSPEEKKAKYAEEESKRKHSKHHRSHKRSRHEKEESPEVVEKVRKVEIEKQPEVSTLSTDNNITVSGDGSSMSVEETNILRQKLGLKPLNLTDTAEDGVQKEEFVHAPAEDLWEKKKQEKLREKLKIMKDKRSLNKKMNKIKTLGEDHEDENDVSSWVEQSRTREKNKDEAQKRDKKLAALDEEFGIGGLVDKEFSNTRQKEYSSKNLKGLQIEHSLEMFKEGKSVILTLKDQEILDENYEDTLVNVNIVDTEKTQKSIDNKTKGIGYKAYEEGEVDELGFIKVKTMLSKYDEEIDGEKRDNFTIGDSGSIDVTWEQQKVQMKKEIHARGVSLAMPALKIASEYLTEEEMTKFKKRKKKVRRVRKRENFKADDLLPLPGTSSKSSDLGSRAGNIPGWDEGIESAKVDETSITSTMLSNDRSVIVDDDEAINELQKALDKARKVKQMKGSSRAREDAGAAKVAEQIEELNNVTLEDPSANYSATISLNSTDEFCRQLGQIPLTLTSIKEEPMDEEQLPDAEDIVMEDEEEPAAGWNTITSEISEKHQANNEEDSHAPIEAEPLATGGLAGALKLAGQKGYLFEEKQAKGSVIVSTNLNNILLSKNYSIEDKNAVDHLDKYAHEKYSRDRNRHDRGMVMEFEEKKNYRPAIKIEYVDETGRNMNPKEAFRKLSHRFHGKGSGKMKLEKRQKKRGEEDMMLKMSSTDTPLNTVAMMKDKLQSEASPYIVLSGAGKTLQAGGPGLMSKKTK